MTDPCVLELTGSWGFGFSGDQGMVAWGYGCEPKARRSKRGTCQKRGLGRRRLKFMPEAAHEYILAGHTQNGTAAFLASSGL